MDDDNAPKLGLSNPEIEKVIDLPSYLENAAYHHDIHLFDAWVTRLKQSFNIADVSWIAQAEIIGHMVGAVPEWRNEVETRRAAVQAEFERVSGIKNKIFGQ